MDSILSLLKQNPNSPATNADAKSGGLLRYFIILLQLAVLSWMVVRYGVEPGLGMPRLIPYVLAGFVVHSFLPFKFRLPFLILLSIGGLFWLMNWIPALVLLGIFVLFFGILQLPISVLSRSIIFLIVGVGFAYIRYGNSAILPEGYRIVPIIGSIFMFRASLYLYEIRFEKKPLPWQQQVAYFLMLPNFVFTLFPIVDYKVFGKSYYDTDSLDIYQKGVRWMIRGFFHLMIYRLLYYYIQPAPGDVVDLHSFALYALTSYMLVTRLSGLFHTSLGILCLFGFNLPRVFHNYFFASGFSDLWRRINIYWRDYVMKIFYYPIYFKMRWFGKINGMVLSVLIVFMITWLLHAYQWFWLKGTFQLRAVDAIFWGIFGVLVAISSVYQQQVPKKKRFSARFGITGKTVLRTFYVLAMLSFMSVLWTFWNSPTINRWLVVLQSLNSPSFLEIQQLGLAILGIGVLIFSGFYLFDNTRVGKILEPSDSSKLSVFWGSLTLLFFALLCIPSVLQIFQPLTEKPVDHIYKLHLTEYDDSQMIQGYYEDILLTNPETNALVGMQQRPDDWVTLEESEAGQATNDWREREMLPNVQTIFKDQTFTTNQWAIRDKDYTKEKPDSTFRMAILGGSYVMGSGVEDSKIFDAVLEDSLNENTELGITYEFINYAMPGFHLIHHAYRLENKVMEFQPDAAMFISHGVDFQKVYQTIVAMNKYDDDYPLPFLDTLLEKYNLVTGVDPNLRKSAQTELGKEVITVTLSYIARVCEENGIIPLIVHWPRTNRPTAEEQVNEYFEMARANGFLIIDIADVYSNTKSSDIMVANFDGHPNDLGHHLVAKQLQEVFETDPYWLEVAKARAEQ